MWASRRRGGQQIAPSPATGTAWPQNCDGDIVCIRKQLIQVEPGEIAAVRIGEEATLKHFYQSGEVVQLVAENAAVLPADGIPGPEQLREICIGERPSASAGDWK